MKTELEILESMFTKEDEEFYAPKPIRTPDNEIAGLIWIDWKDNVLSAEFKGTEVGVADYNCNEYKIGSRGWDIINTGAPGDEVFDFRKAVRTYLTVKR